MEYEDIPAIVIDSGSSACKAGFAGDEAPGSVFSSIVGRPRFKHQEIALDHVVGDEAQIMREFLSLKYPIERGIVTNWEDAEKVWEFCFKDLRADPTAQPLFMSEPMLNPSGYKERLFQTMFETFNVPAFFTNNAALSALVGSSRGGSGIIVDVGEGITRVVPIYFTRCFPQASQCQEFGGRDVTLHLQKLLLERGYSFTTTAELECVREIKEELCYTAVDFDTEMSVPKADTSFVLPDGNKLSIGDEKFQCAECLFQPSLMGYDNLKGLHELVKDCLDKCDMDIRKDFYCNIILTGGATMMSNLPERLGKEVKKLVPPGMVSHIVSLPERKYSVWIGSSIEASLSFFQKAWVTKEQYEEFGPTIVHRRCF